MNTRHSVMVLPALFAVAELATGATDSPTNLPMPRDQLQQRLAHDDFVIRAAKGAGGGVMGARELELQFAQEPTTIKAKWKATNSGGDGWNNSPRREIGVYVIQDFFLEPDEYLVPPTVARCIPLETYRPVDDAAKPTFAGTQCVFGELAAWLQNVKQPEKTYDRERFQHDPVYAERFARLNLLHYLVDHRDSRANNFLVSTDPADPRFFSIDNGIAFGHTLYNFFTWHYNEILVPLPRASIERLRRVAPADLDRLGVLGQLETDNNGILRNVAPGPNIDPENGLRVAPWGVQFGLTKVEIDAVGERMHSLLARIDAGKQPVF